MYIVRNIAESRDLQPDAKFQELKEIIVSLRDGHVENLVDKEFIQTITAKNKFLNQKNLQSSYEKEITNLVQNIDEETVSDIGGIRIVEVDRWIAIFRGFPGGDCSSQFSFPYPNDPYERVFFIYDLKDKLIGAASGTIVKSPKSWWKIWQKQGYTFRLHTINGINIDGLKTRQIVHGIDKIKAKLSLSLNIEKLSFPDNFNGFINTGNIRSALEGLRGKTGFAVSYVRPDIREEIEKFKDTYNTGEYDHIKNNTMAHEYTPGKNNFTEREFENTLKLEIPEKISRGQALGLALELEFAGGFQKEVSSIIKMAKISTESFQKAVGMFSNNELQ